MPQVSILTTFSDMKKENPIGSVHKLALERLKSPETLILATSTPSLGVEHGGGVITNEIMNDRRAK